MKLNHKNLWLFDLDGTLIDSQKGIAFSTNETLKKFGKSELTDLELMQLFGTPIKQVLSSQISLAQLEEAFDFYRNHLLDFAIEQMFLFEGVIETLEELKYQEKALKIITNKHTKLAIQTLEHFGVSDYFIEILGSDLAKPKPSPDLIEIALKGFNQLESVMVGDQIEDIQAGIAAGVNTILIRDKTYVSDGIKADPDYNLRDMKSLLDLVRAS
jgi:HAD superfamily hydrolase (TIGR01509 family)